MTDPEVIDYVPARRESGAGGRIVKSFAVIAVLSVLMGLYRGSIPDTSDMPDGASMALVWYAIAACFGGVALLVGYGRWVRTGRL